MRAVELFCLAIIGLLVASNPANCALAGHRHIPRLRQTIQSSDLRPIDAKLFKALRAGDVNDVERLLKHGANPNAEQADGWPPLLSLESASPHAIEVAKLLIAKGAKVNYRESGQGWTPLIWAVSRGRQNETLIRLLLAHGARVNAAMNDGTTALHFAVNDGNAPDVELLIQHGASLTARTWVPKPLVVNPYARMRREMLAGARTPAERSSIEKTIAVNIAVDIAAKAKAQKETDQSMAKNFEPGYRSSGQTPVFGLAMKWNDGVAAILKKAGADFKAADDNSWTLLHYAVRYANLSALKALLAMGLDPNARSKGGFTPLHLAVRSGFDTPNPEEVKLLLAAGANPSLKNASGQTPADLLRADAARILGHTDPDAQQWMAPEVVQNFLGLANKVQKLLDPAAAAIVVPPPVRDAEGTHYAPLTMGDFLVKRVVRREGGHAILELTFPPARTDGATTVTFKDLQLEDYDPLTPLPIHFKIDRDKPSKLQVAFPPGAELGGAVNATYEYNAKSGGGSGEFAEGPDQNPGFLYQPTNGGSQPAVLGGVPGRILLFRIDSLTYEGKPMTGFAGRVIRVQYDVPAPIVGMVVQNGPPSAKAKWVMHYSVRVLPNTKWRPESTEF